MSVIIPRVGNYLTYKYPVKKSKVQSPKRRSPTNEACEELFVSEYEQVRRVRILSAAHLQKYLVQIRDSLTSQEQHWHDRVAAIQMIRSLLLSGAASHSNFLQLLRTLNVSFAMCLNDVSRQVVRETCVTMAFLAKLLGNDFEHCAEVILPILINAIPILGKGECAMITLKLIVQHTHSSRLIPPFVKGLSSGNATIRRECAKVLFELVHVWPANVLEKRYHMILENMKLRINDTSGETRLNAARTISTLLDRFKDKEKTKPGRRSLSEPRDSYTDIVRMTQSNMSDTGFCMAVSKIKGETLDSLRDDKIQKTHSEPMRRFGDIDDVGHGAESESDRRGTESSRLQSLADQCEVQEVYSSTMEQLSAAMASSASSSGRSSTYYRHTRAASAPRSSPQMPAPPNFEWVLLPSYAEQPFSEEGTGGAALENPPMPYEKSSIKKSLDARKCSSHSEPATNRPKKSGSSQSKSVQQIKQGTTPAATRQGGRQAPRKILATAAATNFNAGYVGRIHVRSTNMQPSSKGGKFEQTRASAEGRPADVEIHLAEDNSETASNAWANSSSPHSNTPEVCQIQSANQVTLANTTADDSPTQITRSASINALSKSGQSASPNAGSATAAARVSTSSELVDQSTYVQEMEYYFGGGIRDECGSAYDRVNDNDYITGTTKYGEEHQDVEEAAEQPAGQTYDDEVYRSVEEATLMTNYLQAIGDNNVSCVPITPLCMTDALASENASNTCDNASLSSCSLATVESAGPSDNAAATAHETANDRLPKRSAFKTVLRKSQDIDSDEGISARTGDSKSRPVCEGVPEKVLQDLGSHASPEKQKQGLHGMKKLLYLRHHLSRKIPSGNLFHRLLAIRKSASKSSPASESSKGTVDNRSAPDLPKATRAGRKR